MNRNDLIVEVLNLTPNYGVMDLPIFKLYGYWFSSGGGEGWKWRYHLVIRAPEKDLSEIIKLVKESWNEQQK